MTAILVAGVIAGRNALEFEILAQTARPLQHAPARLATAFKRELFWTVSKGRVRGFSERMLRPLLTS
jgi:hypothetical protein